MRARAVFLYGTIGVVGLTLAVFGRDIVSGYADAYPWDTARRAALSLCQRRDHLFLRYSASQRETCYGWALGRI